MSAPLDSSGPQSPTLARDDLLSPTTGSHPLPPRPSSNVSSSNAVATEESITESSTKPPQPLSAQAAAAAQIKPPASPTPLSSNVNGTLRSSRLPHDTIGILEDRIKEDSRGDPDAYLELIQEYKNRNRQEDVRATYDRYLAVFPNDAAQWSALLKWEDANDQRPRMEAIFSKALPKVLNVHLWMIYINYVRRQFSAIRDEDKRYKTIQSVFDFALGHIGIDKDAGFIWQEYIAFLKTGKGTLGGNDWQDGAKADSIRGAYQKAIAIPTESVTQLWRDYDTFENGLSKINGRKHLQEMSASYMTARQTYHQLSKLVTGLDRTSQPRLPPRPSYQGDDQWSYQLDLWYGWLEFEKNDPLVLKDDDRKAYLGRVVYVYKQALMALQFWPGMWYSAVDFCFEHGMDTEAMVFLNDGIAANPESPLLAFKLADRLESTTSTDETSDPGARERMKKVRQPYDRLLDALYELVKANSQRETNDIRRLEEESEQMNGDGVDDEVNAANVLSRKAALDAQIAIVKAAALEESDLLFRLISHIWIAIARSTRRIQGKGEGGTGFRAVFNEARKRGRLTSHFYVECSAIEVQCYDDGIGSKILERGMKLFPEDDYLPLHYIKYLIEQKKDVTNARGVFETTVTRLTGAGHSAKTRPLFDYMHNYESRFGELSQIQKLEQRMRDLFPGETPIGLFSDRFATEPFDPIVRFPVISTSQIKRKTESVLPTIEAADNVQSPYQRNADMMVANSPKRSLPDDFDDLQTRKMARGESPLKGAAGRKMNQQRQVNNGPVSNAMPPPLPPPLPPQIHYLMSVLPKPHLYDEARFNAAKMVELLRDVHLPPPGQIQSHHTPQQAPAWPPQQIHQQPQHHFQPAPTPVPGQQYMQAPPPGQAHYGGAPFRFA
ncbi:mRNA 3'-end-processing protein rna14 [Cyphellophora attinorum]|uniref:mRNA 3'-end-processing protein RNA14 n=1 Tax=Cyphellophora attinorum TaxID=1664694 RepID=A0A0N1HSP5_9EURO|nr:mRNA 3'-end-processing protein rna14 [Phialophora attinorum]KPI41700.1 mRNA 3'-end-processing protein rna14 [Phialophora attinorum]